MLSEVMMLSSTTDVPRCRMPQFVRGSPRSMTGAGCRFDVAADIEVTDYRDTCPAG